MSDRIQQLLKICILGLGFTLFALPAHATFIGTEVDFTLIDGANTDQKLDVIVGSGREVFAGDSSDIGENFMFRGVSDLEFINIGADYVEFQIYGGGPTTLGNGFKTTGAAADAKYQIDFAVGVLALFEIPTASDLGLNDISGVTFGTELMLASNSLMLFIDTLGVDPADFGTVRLDFQLKDIPAVPVPAALPLMLSGLAMIGFLARRRKS